MAEEPLNSVNGLQQTMPVVGPSPIVLAKLIG